MRRTHLVCERAHDAVALLRDEEDTIGSQRDGAHDAGGEFPEAREDPEEARFATPIRPRYDKRPTRRHKKGELRGAAHAPRGDDVDTLER